MPEGNCVRLSRPKRQLKKDRLVGAEAVVVGVIEPGGCWFAKEKSRLSTLVAQSSRIPGFLVDRLYTSCFRNLSLTVPVPGSPA